MTTHLRIATATAFLTLSLVSSSTARAQTDYLWPHFSIAAGAYAISTEDEIGIEGEIGRNDDRIDFSADFGLPDDKTLLTARFDWAFADRHSLGLSYYSFEREGRRDVGTIIEIGGIEFPIGATVEASLETRAIEMNYDYWFVRRENFGFAGSLGLVYLTLDANASATARIAGGSITLSESESASTDLPVPMIGVAFKGRPWSRVVLRAHGRILPSVQIGDYDGEAASYGAGIEYFIYGPLGLGASYEGSYYRAEIEDPDWAGSVDLDTSGWRLYLRASF